MATEQLGGETFGRRSPLAGFCSKTFCYDVGDFQPQFGHGIRVPLSWPADGFDGDTPLS